jgi:hypothetical protein
MSSGLAIVLAIVIVIVTIIVMAAIFGGRRQREQEEELKRAASARGWTFEIVREKGYRIQRWTATTEGVSWIAESAVLTTGGSKNQRRRHIARWQGDWSPGINGAIVAMGVPKGKEQLGKTIAEGEGFFAKLAQKAAGLAFDKAIDVYFGDGPGQEVDAGAMRRVETDTPGFIVMAADKDEGARILSQGLEKALVDAANDTRSVLAHEDRPWILLRPKAVALARMEKFRDIDEIEGFLRAGLALTRVFKFGRNSA